VDDALDLFARELTALRARAGNPPYKQIVHQARRQQVPVAMNTSTLSDWFHGRSAPNAGPPIRFLLEYLRARAATQHEVPQVSWYEQLRAAAWAQTHSARGGRPLKPRDRHPGQGEKPERRDAAQPSGIGAPMRVCDADPFHLGVHQPIRVLGASQEVLPPYVRRDADNAIRQRIEAAARRGGFVVLVGGSSVGKTRSLYEVVRRLLPHWRLLQPGSTPELAAVATGSTHQLVVWLDQLQNHLDGLSVSTVRALLRTGTVIVGTLWPRHHAAFTAPAPLGELEADRYQSEREILHLAEVVHLPGEFSASEQQRAYATAKKAASVGDLRLRVALKNTRFGSASPVPGPPHRAAQEKAIKADQNELSFKLAEDGHLSMRQLHALRLLYLANAEPDDHLRVLEGTRFGFTQTIAAAPQLIERWHNADPDENPYAHAVLAAAIDAARLGARAALPAALLRAAAPGYCTAAQRARATTEGWFERAIEYATQPLLGATATLVPILHSGLTDDQRSFRVADYLLQFASTERAVLSPPASFWDACTQHLTDAADLGQVGDAACERLRFGYAIPLIRRAVEGGDRRSLHWLETILYEQDETDQVVELHQICRDRHIDIDEASSVQLAKILLDHGRAQEAADELRPHADSNPSGIAPVFLADALGKMGEIDELRSRASDGDSSAALALSSSLSRDVQEKLKSLEENRKGLEVLREDIDKMLETLDELGLGPADDSDELTHQIEEIPNDEFQRVAAILSQHIAQLQQGIAQDNEILLHINAQMEEQKRLAVLLPHVPESTDSDQHTDSGGNMDALRSSPRSHDNAWKLAGLLLKQDKHDEALAVLRERVESGDDCTALWLSELLAAHGRGEEALTLLHSRVAAGDPFAFIWLDYLLAERGDASELEARVQAGDAVALERLIYVTADRLAEQGEHAEAFAALRRLADAGNRYMAMGEMAEWLTRHGRADEAWRLRCYGLTADGAIADGPGPHEHRPSVDMSK
jgi:hypothetical protein